MVYVVGALIFIIGDPQILQMVSPQIRKITFPLFNLTTSAKQLRQIRKRPFQLISEQVLVILATFTHSHFHLFRVSRQNHTII